MKDSANLVKSYAMVNVAQYQIMAVGSTVPECEQAYIKLLSSKGIAVPDALPQTQVSGQVADIRTAVLEGDTYYFIQLEDEAVYYSVSAVQNRDVVTLNIGDAVAPEGESVSILDGYSLTISRRAPRTYPGNE